MKEALKFAGRVQCRVLGLRMLYDAGFPLETWLDIIKHDFAALSLAASWRMDAGFNYYYRPTVVTEEKLRLALESDDMSKDGDDMWIVAALGDLLESRALRHPAVAAMVACGSLALAAMLKSTWEDTVNMVMKAYQGVLTMRGGEDEGEEDS